MAWIDEKQRLVRRTGAAVVAALLLASCGKNPRPAPSQLASAGSRPPEAGEESAPSRIRTASTRVLIVLDTVRADHLSLCGYPRPTSPFLSKLAEQATAWSCRAYSPGSWTQASHASYFTGLEVQEHGAVARLTGDKFSWGGRFYPLDDRFPTLAERMREKGYQTVLISANPVVSEETGLVRGFDSVVVAKRWWELRGPRLVSRLAQLLSTLEPTQPLFLFVNIIDAHVPYAPIPEGVGWVPPQPPFDMNWQESSVQYRYVAGEASPEEAEAFRSWYTDQYDYALSRADQTLAHTVSLLEKDGWLGETHRVVITSDHGELLAEHGLVAHGQDVWESVVRVPFMVLSTEGEVEIEEPWPAIHAFDLILGDSLEPREVSAVAFPTYRAQKLFAAKGPRHGSIKAALWQGDEKYTWSLDQFQLFDLKKDPNELTPMPLHNLAAKATLARIVSEARGLNERNDEPSQTLEQRLRALGYVD